MIKLNKLVQIYIIVIVSLVGFSIFYFFVIFLPNQPKQKTSYQSCIEEAQKNQYKLYQKLCNKYGTYEEGKCFLPEDVAKNFYDGLNKLIKHCIQLYK